MTKKELNAIQERLWAAYEEYPVNDTHDSLCDIPSLIAEIERLSALIPHVAETCNLYDSYFKGCNVNGLAGYGYRCQCWDGGVCSNGKWELKEG